MRVFASGLSEFGNGPGDHRMVFVDIPKVDIDGFDMSPIQQMPRRRLISTNIKVSGRFNELFLAQVERNSLLTWTKTLHSTACTELELAQMEASFEKKFASYRDQT